MDHLTVWIMKLLLADMKNQGIHLTTVHLTNKPPNAQAQRHGQEELWVTHKTLTRVRLSDRLGGGVEKSGSWLLLFPFALGFWTSGAIRGVPLLRPTALVGRETMFGFHRFCFLSIGSLEYPGLPWPDGFLRWVATPKAKARPRFAQSWLARRRWFSP